MPCPLCDEEEKYKKLLKDTSLDCVKQYFVNKELPYFKEVEKGNLIEGKLPDVPLNKNHNSTLLKVTLIHFLNKAFAENEECIKHLKIKKLPDFSDRNNYQDYLDFNRFAKDFRQYIKQHNQCNLDDTDTGTSIINDWKFKANLIKVLSAQSLKKYRGVYIAVFYWVLCELIVAIRAILGNEKYEDYRGQYNILTQLENIGMLTDFSVLTKSLLTDADIDKYIDAVNYVRLLIKYASSLDIAYLLHQDFIAAINKLCMSFSESDIEKLEEKIKKHHKSLLDKWNEMRYSFENFKLFCTSHIIRSLHNNAQRAIRFEKNISELYSKNPNSPFLELLILENTSIIRQTLNNITEKPLDHQDPLLMIFSLFVM